MSLSALQRLTDDQLGLVDNTLCMLFDLSFVAVYSLQQSAAAEDVAPLDLAGRLAPSGSPFEFVARAGWYYVSVGEMIGDLTAEIVDQLLLAGAADPTLKWLLADSIAHVGRVLAARQRVQELTRSYQGFWGVFHPAPSLGPFVMHALAQGVQVGAAALVAWAVPLESDGAGQLGASVLAMACGAAAQAPLLAVAHRQMGSCDPEASLVATLRSMSLKDFFTGAQTLVLWQGSRPIVFAVMAGALGWLVGCMGGGSGGSGLVSASV